MSNNPYSPYYDPFSPAAVADRISKRTNDINAKIEKDWSDRLAEERRLRDGMYPSGDYSSGGYTSDSDRGKRGGGALFLLAAALVAGGLVLLHLL
jgi:hypothetical protein